MATELPKRFYQKNRFFKNEGTLLDELSFICFYHHSRLNQTLHVVSVAILQLILVCLSLEFAPLFLRTSVKIGPIATEVSVFFLVFMAGYSLFFISLDPLVGLLNLAFFVLDLFLYRTLLHPNSHHPLFWPSIVAVIVICATAQIGGIQNFDFNKERGHDLFWVGMAKTLI